MKPFITLAASTPFLLLAGVGHAATFSFSDPNCSSFTFSSGVISCVTGSTAPPTVAPTCSVNAPSSVAVNTPVTISAYCSPGPITGYVWTGTPTVNGESTSNVTFATPGDYTYTVKGTNEIGTGAFSPAKKITVTAADTGLVDGGTVGSCPSTPASTTIIAIGGKDNYASKDFDVVFDHPGATLDSAVAAGKSKAFQFTNGEIRTGYLYSEAGNYGSGYKDWALSLCPGDFTASLGVKCALSRKSTIAMGFSTDGSLGCKIPANQPVYLNIRGTAGIAAGWVIQSLQVTAQ